MRRAGEPDQLALDLAKQGPTTGQDLAAAIAVSQTFASLVLLRLVLRGQMVRTRETRNGRRRLVYRLRETK